MGRRPVTVCRVRGELGYTECPVTDGLTAGDGAAAIPACRDDRGAERYIVSGDGREGRGLSSLFAWTGSSDFSLTQLGCRGDPQSTQQSAIPSRCSLVHASALVMTGRPDCGNFCTPQPVVHGYHWPARCRRTGLLGATGACPGALGWWVGSQGEGGTLRRVFELRLLSY